MQTENTLDEIRDELRELRELLTAPPLRPDDLVDASYVAARTGLKERTVLAGKAGTNEIPRVLLRAENASRPLVRFARSAVDNWIRKKIAIAAAQQPRARALRVLNRKKSGSTAA